MGVSIREKEKGRVFNGSSSCILENALVRPIIPKAAALNEIVSGRPKIDRIAKRNDSLRSRILRRVL